MLNSRGCRLWGRTSNFAYWLWVGLLLLPLAVLVPLSLNSSNYPTIWPEAVSLDGYRRLLVDPSWSRAIASSLLIGVISSALSVGLALPFGFWMAQRRGLAPLALSFSLLPVAIPPIAIAAGYYKAWGPLGLVDSFAGIIPVHVLLVTPIACVVLYGRCRKISGGLYRTARSLGATLPETWGRILIPALKQTIIRAWLLGVFVSIDETIVALFLSESRVQTLPKRIWTGLRYELDPAVASSGIILIVLMLSLFRMPWFRWNSNRVQGSFSHET